MLPYESLAMATMMAWAYSRVRQREWLSSTIVVLALILFAAAVGPVFQAIVLGREVGILAKLALFWFVLLTGYSALRAYEDFKNPPDKGSPGRGRRSPSY